MARYRFRRSWSVPAEPEHVFDAFLDTTDWPRWWTRLVRVETIRDGDDGVVGREQRFTLRAPAGYQLVIDGRIVDVDRPRRLVASLSGDLDGTGRLVLEQAGDQTRLHYEIDVETTVAWMNLLAPVLRPLLVKNHDRVVRSAISGLLEKLTADADRDNAGE